MVSDPLKSYILKSVQGWFPLFKPLCLALLKGYASVTVIICSVCWRRERMPTLAAHLFLSTWISGIVHLSSAYCQEENYLLLLDSL
jgi:hypothetical protein